MDYYGLALIAGIAFWFSRALLNVSRAMLNFVKAYRLAFRKTTRKPRRRK